MQRKPCAITSASVIVLSGHLERASSSLRRKRTWAHSMYTLQRASAGSLSANFSTLASGLLRNSSHSLRCSRTERMSQKEVYCSWAQTCWSSSSASTIQDILKSQSPLPSILLDGRSQGLRLYSETSTSSRNALLTACIGPTQVPFLVTTVSCTTAGQQSIHSRRMLKDRRQNAPVSSNGIASVSKVLAISGLMARVPLQTMVQ